MDRILLVSGDMVRSGDTLRRRVLRFTRSRKATRMVMKQIEGAQRLGQIMSCMVVSRPGSAAVQDGDESLWDVRVSYATAAGRSASQAKSRGGRAGYPKAAVAHGGGSD